MENIKFCNPLKTCQIKNINTRLKNNEYWKQKRSIQKVVVSFYFGNDFLSINSPYIQGQFVRAILCDCP